MATSESEPMGQQQPSLHGNYPASTLSGKARPAGAGLSTNGAFSRILEDRRDLDPPPCPSGSASIRAADSPAASQRPILVPTAEKIGCRGRGFRFRYYSAVRLLRIPHALKVEPGPGISGSRSSIPVGANRVDEIAFAGSTFWPSGGRPLDYGPVLQPFTVTLSSAVPSGGSRSTLAVEVSVSQYNYRRRGPPPLDGPPHPFRRATPSHMRAWRTYDGPSRWTSRCCRVRSGDFGERASPLRGKPGSLSPNTRFAHWRLGCDRATPTGTMRIPQGSLSIGFRSAFPSYRYGLTITPMGPYRLDTPRHYPRLLRWRRAS